MTCDCQDSEQRRAIIANEVRQQLAHLDQKKAALIAKMRQKYDEDRTALNARYKEKKASHTAKMEEQVATVVGRKLAEERERWQEERERWQEERERWQEERRHLEERIATAERQKNAAVPKAERMERNHNAPEAMPEEFLGDVSVALSRPSSVCSLNRSASSSLSTSCSSEHFLFDTTTLSMDMPYKVPKAVFTDGFNQRLPYLRKRFDDIYKHDLFISYSVKDSEAVYSVVANMFISRGLDVFNPKKSLQDTSNGKVDEEEMQKHVKGSGLVLVVLSKQFFGSSFCRAEVQAVMDMTRNGSPVKWFPCYAGEKYTREGILDLKVKGDPQHEFLFAQNLNDVHNHEHQAECVERLNEIMFHYVKDGSPSKSQ